VQIASATYLPHVSGTVNVLHAGLTEELLLLVVRASLPQAWGVVVVIRHGAHRFRMQVRTVHLAGSVAALRHEVSGQACAGLLFWLLLCAHLLLKHYLFE